MYATLRILFQRKHNSARKTSKNNVWTGEHPIEMIIFIVTLSDYKTGRY